MDVGRIENLPLNGRQFANLAATIPGVGLGFHSDPTKSSQFSPQVNGGNGRNVNYQIDGGDNNDDTVGGLLQNFPLEAIQEFNFVTQRFKAEYGRSNGGVMNIVTKSGTNQYRGSAFSLVRDKSLNARTHSEKAAGAPKADYRRYQSGGSFGGPIVRDRAFYFGAFERTQQDTNQQVDTLGLFPSEDGVYKTPIRETLLNVKQTTTINAAQYLAVRYGRNTNTQPYGAGLRFVPSSWSTSTNTFNSINANHNWVLGGSRLNEFIFQYANFANSIGLSSSDPYELFPNTVAIGANPNTPQATEQNKWQFRDDFSWSVTGMGGLGHDMKAGANFINEPHLYATFNSGVDDYQYTHLTDDRNGPIQTITRNGGVGSVNIPFKQYAAYIQDDWRVSDRLTLNLGLRYDLVTGVQIDQSQNPNFLALQAAGRAGRFAGIPGHGGLRQGSEGRSQQHPAARRLRVGHQGQRPGRGPRRLGRLPGLRLHERQRALPGHRRQRPGARRDFLGEQPGRHLKSGRHVLHRSAIRSRPSTARTKPIRPGCRSSVRWCRRASSSPTRARRTSGWAHQLGTSTAITADYVHIDGRDLNMRFRYNYLDPATGLRRLCGSRRPAEHAGIPRGDQRRDQPVRRADTRSAAPAVERARLHGVVHARAGKERHRRRLR